MVITLPREIIHATVRHAFGPHPHPLHRKCLRRSSISPAGVILCAAPNLVRSALHFSCNCTVFSGLRALVFSCRSFWCSFPLFSVACGLFCKIPGGRVPLLAASARPHLPQRNVDAGRTSNYHCCKLQVPGPWMKLPNSRHSLLWATLTPFPPVSLCLIPSRPTHWLCSTKSVAKSLPSSIAKSCCAASRSASRNSLTITFLASCSLTKRANSWRPLSRCVTVIRSRREYAFLSTRASPALRPLNAAAFALRIRSPTLAFLPVRWRPACPCARNWWCRY